jgi:hypothetical protein
MGRTTMASMDGKSGEVDVPQSLSSCKVRYESVLPGGNALIPSQPSTSTGAVGHIEELSLDRLEHVRGGFLVLLALYYAQLTYMRSRKKAQEEEEERWRKGYYD